MILPTTLARRRKKLYAAMRAAGNKFVMFPWIEFDTTALDWRKPTPELFEECGTAACVAGTGAMLMPRKIRPALTFEDIAASDEQIADYYGLKTKAFYKVYWPKSLQTEYDLGTQDVRIKTAIKACEFFIVT